MTRQEAIQFIAEALGEYADTMRPINKKLFIEKAQAVMAEIQKPEQKAES
ncbi:MAG: hypothetical protein ACRCWJ_04850 [Casimicrobium sp.]